MAENMSPHDDIDGELWEIYYTQAYEILEDIRDSALRLEADPGNAEEMKALQRYLHTLKGDSNSIGLECLGSLCHRAEDVFELIHSKEKGVDREFINLLLGCADEVESLLRASEAGDDLPAESCAIKLIDTFLGTGNCAESPEQVEKPLTEYEKLHLKEAARGGRQAYEIEIRIHAMCTEKEVAALLISQRLESLGDVVKFEHLSTDGGGEKVVAVLCSDSGEDEIKERAHVGGISESIEVRACQTESARAGGTAHRRSETVRISVGKVDTMMNLVGELIIGRSILGQIAKDAEEGVDGEDVSSRLASLNSYFDRTVSDLQRGIMKMRMVQVDQVFRKMPRMVREIADEKDKKVRVEIYGRETELDRGIVDSLGEPLSHIVRNCIDHGIETPEQRRSAGKPEEGVIRLRAYHEAGSIVIEAGDDGRGLDIEKLRQKAVELGILDSVEAQRASDTRIAQMVFVSGLSTSESVTDVSGRGIGMDAVKTAVEAIKGSISVYSSPGKGTSFVMRLPLTLAVIKAMLARVADKVYAVPVPAILEVTKLDPERIASVDGRDTLCLRDDVISLIHLNRLFGHAEEEREAGFAVIVGINGRKVGLVVDGLAGQQELVIKAVDESYSNSNLVAGASILGDGRVVLILDVQSVFRTAVNEEKRRLAGV